MEKLVVIAIGGNSLIKDDSHLLVEDQYTAVCDTAKKIADIIEKGFNVVITHGNGPQVGFIMRRSEIAQEFEHMHPVPLVNCDADTQGAIGYQIQQALQNEFIHRGLKKNAVTVITQVEVDPRDDAFISPSKPIGRFYNEELIESIKKEHPDWILKNDAGRGYRRLVPSPKPINIIESPAIQTLIENEFTVIAVGGGGIPVIREKNGNLNGINAVIDKDHASSLLACNINADIFIISTAVENVFLNYKTKNQKALECVTLSELKLLKDAGHFAAGSMLPKIEAVISFLEKGGKKAIITSPDKIADALLGGKAGTIIINW